jgi:hypothetical protein
MIGPILIVLVVVVVVPVGLLMTSAGAIALLGWTLKSDAEQRHEGSELLDLN